MGEIKRWLAREYVAIPEGNKGMVEVPASWMRAPEKEFKIFVLASDHDAAMAEKDREIDRLKAEAGVFESAHKEALGDMASLRVAYTNLTDTLKAKDAEIDRLKAENDVLRARSIVAGLKDDVRRMADGLWDVPPSTSDIVDEIGKRLRR